MRPLGKLKDIQVRTLGPGVHGDGGGLQLSVKQGVTGIHRTWVFRYSFAGHAHLMGLGPYPDVSLQRARQKALECRQQLHDGIDPLAHKRNQRASVAREAAKQSVPSFDECRDAYVASHRAGWRNVRHSHDWVRSLQTHVTPIFGSTPVDMIDTALVCKALEPIWRTRTETASRVRGRIEAVLNWAQTRGYRGNGPNPARWKGHLANILPAPRKVATVAHLAAMPYADVPSFMAMLRERTGVSPIALQFLVLTACRTSEVLGARWDEFDLSTATWTIPGRRMKGGKEHRVPLSPLAVRLITGVADTPVSDFVFAGRNRPRLTE